MLYRNIRAILTDIEGTTSSIDFVKSVLFPYARKQLADFLQHHSQEDEVQQILTATAALTGIASTDLAALTQQYYAWIDADAKITPLKAIQGLIWQFGYEQGDYQAHMYADAVLMLQQWHQQGIPIYIYSSGSIKAQQLFFRYSIAGDLGYLVNGYFDTTTGPKTEPQSYRKIAAELGESPAHILFLSDAVAELDAAQAAAMQVCQLQRGNVKTSTYPVVNSFADIKI